MKEELERLDEQHKMLKFVLRNLPDPLFLVPTDRLEHVLDCGHGSGAWIVEVAQAYPECEVISHWDHTYLLLDC